jgi:hypothetical protein
MKAAAGQFIGADDDERRLSDELRSFVPAHDRCHGSIAVAVIPAQRHGPTGN